MPTVTVLEKLYGSGSPETFKKLCLDLLGGLKVQLTFVRTTERNWIQLDVSGDDERVALNLLDREFGLAPASLSKLKRFSAVQGKVVFSSKSKEMLYVDVGVVSPQICDATISARRLCAQLADGKDLPLQSLVELFCLHDNVRLEVKITEEVNKQKDYVEAYISEAQVLLFNRWVHNRFDRLIVLGSQFSEVEEAVKLSRHSRDIIRIESLGFMEQTVLCKLGTDAVGLIPKLGSRLKKSVLVPFSPKKILQVVGNSVLH